MRTDRERGSATVWVMALSGVLAAVSLAVVLVGSAVVARHRASTAADLAALAAAGSAVAGRPDACAVAGRVAAANSAVLASCVAEGAGVVRIRVNVAVRLGPLGVHSATGRARAGPVPP
jgi:secretion/DNA translocation related TadE-like protein